MDEEVIKAVADIQIQAIMFSMEIDWETLTLIEKIKVEPEPQWLISWKAKREESDFNELMDIDWSDNGR